MSVSRMKKNRILDENKTIPEGEEGNYLDLLDLDDGAEYEKLLSQLSNETIERLKQNSKLKESSDKKKIKGCIVPIRFSEKELIEIDELVTLASNSTGIDVGRSWVIRELIKIGSEAFISRYKK